MNLNKEFLSEIISYLINKGVTLTDVLDTFNEHFNTSDDAIKYEHEKRPEVRKPITDIDLLLCGREVEKQGFNKDIKEHVTVTENITESPYKLVATPLTPLSHKNTEEKTEPLNVSLSPNTRDYPTSITPRGKGVSKARKMLFEVVEGKTVLEHLKANNINYKLFDTRIRKNWTMEKACTTPMTRVIRPYTKSKKPEEHKVVEESSPKTKMMLVNGRMTEIKASDTDLVCSSIEKPEKTIETETKTLETESNTEKATESVTNATELNGNNVTAVILDTPNPDAIRKDKDDNIEKALKKFVTHSEEPKKDKKPKEPKKDYTFSDLCLKLSLTTHELKEMISTCEFPQPDCGTKWSVKLLKEKGVI